MTRKSIYYRLLTSTFFVFIISFGVNNQANADTIKVGVSMPLTGNFAVPGTKHLEGYKTCVDVINRSGGWLDREVELVVNDNRSDTETAISQYERFINVDKVDLTFGTFSSKLTFPISPILAKYNSIHPIPSGGALRIFSQGHKNLFYFQASAAEYVGSNMVGLLNELVASEDKPTRAALVHADDFFANSIATGLLGNEVRMPGSGDLVEDMAPGYIVSAGMEVVYHEQWPEEGFSDWLVLANSIKRSKADLVIALMASPEEASQFARALKIVKHNPKHLILSQGTQSEFLEALGDSAEGIIIMSAYHADAPYKGLLGGNQMNNSDFVAEYHINNGKLPDEDVAITYALCQGIDQAVRATGSLDNQKLMDWLHARTPEDPVQTVLGNFSWDERGLPLDKSFLMVQWQNDRLEFVYPTNEFQAQDIISPKPEW
ncbi:amino acid ABC transporter substrate-binding protein [Hyphomicrobiales bacterium]|nr:amino acid ABC transporter substrate-binding protein [Hyphomicrobiales bacterium]